MAVREFFEFLSAFGFLSERGDLSMDYKDDGNDIVIDDRFGLLPDPRDA